MTNGDGKSDKTSNVSENKQDSTGGQEGQQSLNTSDIVSRRKFLKEGLRTGLGFLTRGLGDPEAKS